MREWSLQEAQGALPAVRQMLARGRQCLEDLREVHRHMEDLRIVHGRGVGDPGHAAHDEWGSLAADAAVARQELQQALQAFADAGVMVKDVDLGLVDFPSRRGSELVLLCWRDGEERIEAWHPLEGGFAARQPVPEILPDV